MRTLLSSTTVLLALVLLVGAKTGSAPTAASDAQPLPTLTPAQIALFTAGTTEFHQRWSVAPSAFGVWGRGPTSNGEGCTDCHPGAGRGQVPERPDEPLRSGLLRLSLPGTAANGAPLPHPAYGDQLQFEGVLGKVPGEGEVYLLWRSHSVTFPDGEAVTLRRPVLALRELQFGPIGRETLLSLRIAPAVKGLGLLAAVSERSILAREAEQQSLGLHGRANVVWDQAAHQRALGRFGRKANQPSLRQQIAGALLNDIGVTSELYPEENCPAPQTACRAFPRPPAPEIKSEQLRALEFYLQALAAPEQRGADDQLVRRGEQLFEAAGCAACHLPQLVTGDSSVQALGRQTIRPYTDLLVHDMGEGLADGRPDFLAGPRDWRTTPLWGIGKAQGSLLHDGRARTLVEAILWHGGEGHRAREAFRTMPKTDRTALLSFLRSL